MVHSTEAAEPVPPPFAQPAAVAIGHASAPAVDNSRDIAVMDRVLATVTPGQELVQFGCVAMNPLILRAMRDQLVAEHNQPPAYDSATLPSVPWAGGNIYYRFDPDQVANNTITANKKQAFRDAAAEWAAFANIRFIEISNPAGYSHYITVRVDPNLTGGTGACGSWVYGNGTGEQFIEIGPTCWNRRLICHEVGHALGLHHEQQRPDRDSYLVVLWENIAPEHHPNFAKVPSNYVVNHGSYDFYSVMHYPRHLFAESPELDSIRPQPAYSQFLDIMGQVFDRALSKLDRAGMATFYGNPSLLPSALVTNTKDSGPGSLRTALYYGFDRSTNVPPAATTIAFNIPTSDPGFSANVLTIKPTSVLVAPGAGTTIDGGTQTAFAGNTNPSGPEIVLNGSLFAGQGVSAPGLILREANCILRNLVINGFNQQGVLISGSNTSGSVITASYIGTNATGSAGVANALEGIEITSGAHDNTIGGTVAGTGNVIAFNGFHGVHVQNGLRNRILGNSIHTNDQASSPNNYLGISLGTDPVTPNDSGDSDSGANGLQNFPVISSAAYTGSDVRIVGSLNSIPNQTYRVEFFASDTSNASGHGEGRFPLGFVNVSANSSGNGSFDATFPVPAGAQTVSATATDPGGNTSEFSLARQISALPSALQLTGATSRKTHGGGAGIFDLNLPMTGQAGVECRSGGVGGNHTLVFTFTNDVSAGSATVTGGTGSVTGSPAFSGKTMTVNLAGVANAQTLTIALANVSDGITTINASVAMGVLLGDVNGSGVVSGSDVNLTKARQSKPIMPDPNGNFRSDINLSGVISGSDVNQIKTRNSSHL